VRLSELFVLDVDVDVFVLVAFQVVDVKGILADFFLGF